MVCVQSTAAPPIVRAFEAGERFAEPLPNAATIASGLRVPAAVGDFMILDAVRAQRRHGHRRRGGAPARVDAPGRLAAKAFPSAPKRPPASARSKASPPAAGSSRTSRS